MNMLGLLMRSLLARRKVERELDEELRYHLERQIEEEIARGKAAEEAREAALRSMGGLAQRKEECRDARGLNLIDHAWQDARYAARQLIKSPAFTCAAVFVLALSIGATATIYAFVEAALIKPLPYRDTARLMAVFEASPGDARSFVSYRDFADWQKRNHVFSSLDAFALNGGFTMRTAGGVEHVPGTRVSAGFFRVLKVVPIVGRDFLPGEDASGAPRTAVITYEAWEKRFGGKIDVLGRTVVLNNAPNTIIGVLPRDFHFAAWAGAEFWTTLRDTDTCEQHRECHNLITIGRLKPGVSVETASADMRSIVEHLRREYPESNRDFGSANLVPLRDLILGDVQPILLMLLSGAGLLLAIALVNVTMLLLARSDKRRREIAVRGALGASSARLFHQFGIEGLALASLGGGFALLIVEWGTRFLMSLVPPDKMETMPYLQGLGLDMPAVLFVCAISLFAGLLFAAIPIARISLAEVIEGLREGGRAYAGTTWRRFGSNLVICELAIAMVLMAGAGLLSKSLFRLLHVETGLVADHLADVQTAWAPGNYEEDSQKIVLARSVLGRISALPGVKSAGVSTAVPIDSEWGISSFHVAGRPERGKQNEAIKRQVSAGYFATLGARLLRGRYFREDEDRSKPRVAIINRSLAKKYFEGQDAIGQQIYFDAYGGDPIIKMEIVGVIDDIREGSLEGAAWPAIYTPFNQNPVAWFAILIRTSHAETSLSTRIAAAIHGIDPLITVSELQPMTERIDHSPSAYLHRSSAWLAATFAVVAFVLGIVGLYGAIAYSVSHRTREIGIRMALGAEAGAVYRMVLGEGGRLVTIGLAIGGLGSVAAAVLMRGLLFGVESWDAPTLVIAALLLAGAALLATYIPAKRAASVNPIAALRNE
jgi:predicted permease